MTSKHFTGRKKSWTKNKLNKKSLKRLEGYNIEDVLKIMTNRTGKVFNAFAVLTISKVEQRTQER